jgi:hypothetical protein
MGPKDAAPAHDESEEFDEEQNGTDLQSMVFFILLLLLRF